MQLPLFPDDPPERIVNVASVKHYSPFRYPGGKTWLVPRIRHWLMCMSYVPDVFIEPFAGGAIVGLTVAFEHLANRVILVERDEQVAAVWQTILDADGAAWLANRIVEFDLTTETVDVVLADNPQTIHERAFQTIVRNRVNRGGILAAGAGRVKHGENGKGLASRWYPQTLQRRILAIAAIHERIQFIAGDGMAVMQAYQHQEDAVFFIDPPYTAAGKKPGSRLYTYSEIDHAQLFALTATLAGEFLLTYNATEDIHQMARQHGFDMQPVAMKNTHHARLTELLIGRDMTWLR